MPRPIGTTFADLLGKLAVVRVECSKCGRFRSLSVAPADCQHGGNGTIIAWLDALTADCPRKHYIRLRASRVGLRFSRGVSTPR
jgi:hypothetical protein